MSPSAHRSRCFLRRDEPVLGRGATFASSWAVQYGGALRQLRCSSCTRRKYALSNRRVSTNSRWPSAYARSRVRSHVGSHKTLYPVEVRSCCFSNCLEGLVLRRQPCLYSHAKRRESIDTPNRIRWFLSSISSNILERRFEFIACPVSQRKRLSAVLAKRFMPDTSSTNHSVLSSRAGETLPRHHAPRPSPIAPQGSRQSTNISTSGF